MLWTLLALALAHDHPEPAPPPAPVPVAGLADLHLHQWAELAYASRWYHGDGDGPGPAALPECGDVMEYPRVPRRVQHGVVVRSKVVPDALMRMFAQLAMQDERSDDVRPKHPPGGISTAGSLPHWLGWPTSDSLAHQQVWDGWLRLAHDGVPLLWWLRVVEEEAAEDDNPAPVDITEAVARFYDDYEGHMADAARAGAVGLNLAVVSLVHNNLMCRQQVSQKARRDNPAICNDMDAIRRQYDAALAFAEAHDWVEVVATPADAERAIQRGRLAIVLGLEASDVFGPSETIGYGSPFAGGYAERAEVLVRGGASRPDAVRQALGEYLDELPMVVSVQPSHQYDTPFAGAAFVTAMFVKQQQWRDRRPRTIDTAEGPVRCRKAAEAWKWDDELSAYPMCQASLATDVGGSPALAGFFRLFENLPPAHKLPRAYRKQSPTSPYTNPYGLSVDGEALVDVLRQRGLLVDTSHMSRRALADLATVDDGPTFSSHAYPQSVNLLEREQNVRDDDLARLDVVGVRPGDDEVDRDGGPEGSRFAAQLKVADCQGTSVATGLYLEATAQAGPRLAYGTDLNGFINQPAATGSVRPPVWGGRPCAVQVPSIGSEVGQRGLAHIGLLPQLHMEALAAGGPSGEQAIASASDGVGAFLDLWWLAWCGASDPDPRCAARVAPPSVAPWNGWRDWVYDDAGALRTAAVPLPLTRPRQAGRMATEDDGGTDIVRAASPTPQRTDLPRWRAIEATVPMFLRQDPARSPIVAQLPTRIGFLIGAYGMRASWRRFHFPVRRCMRSGYHGLTEPGDRRRKRAHCAELRDARASYMKAYRRRTDTNHMLGVWDRLYAGPVHTGTGVDDLQSLHGRLGVLDQDDDTTWHDWPTYDLVVDRLLADDGACLVVQPLLDAPPPGLSAGQAPVEWLEAEPNRRARGCYCSLLDDVAAAGLALPRDELARTSEWCPAPTAFTDRRAP